MTLTFDPITNFNWVQASTVSNHLTKIASKSVHPFGWNFVHKCRTHRHTDRHTQTHRQTHTHRDTDKLQWKYNPSSDSRRCNKLIPLYAYLYLPVNFGCQNILAIYKYQNLSLPVTHFQGNTSSIHPFSSISLQVKEPGFNQAKWLLCDSWG